MRLTCILGWFFFLVFEGERKVRGKLMLESFLGRRFSSFSFPFLLSLSRFPVCFGSLKIGQISASTCHPFMEHQLAVFVSLQGQVAGVNFKEKGHNF